MLEAMRAALPLLLFALAARAESEIAIRLEPARAGVEVAAWDALAPWRMLGIGRTDGEGRCSLAVEEATREHPFGPWLLAVRGGGVAWRRIEVSAGTREFAIDVEGARGREGVVVDHEGKPVPGAIVRGLGPEGVVEETTTDEAGRFALVAFATEPEVVAERDGLRAAVRDGKGCFPPPKRLSSVVIDGESGKPIAGAVVFARMQTLAISDAKGAFAVTLSEEEWDVEVAQCSFIADPVPDLLTVRAEGYEVAAVEGEVVRLARIAPVAGRVVDEQEAPVAGCRIAFGRDSDFTDDSGRFRFTTPRRGFATLRASREGFLAAQVRVEAGRAADDVTLRLRRGARVAGTVLWEGAPAVGVRVSFRRGGDEVAFAYSDRDGLFVAPGVPVEADSAVAVAGPRRSLPAPLSALREGEQAPPLRLALAKELAVRGLLRSDTGVPLAGATIGLAFGARAVTDAEGRFDLGKLPCAPQDLHVNAKEHAPHRLRVWPGEPIDAVIPSRLGRNRLAIHVAGVGGATIRIEIARRGAPALRRSNPGGPGAQFEDLPAGDYDLLVEAEGFLPARALAEVRGDGAETKVTLAPERGGTVRLVASPGAAVAVETVRGRPSGLAALELAAGEKEIADLGPGLYRFISRAKGELIVVREIELGPSTLPQALDLRGGKEALLDLLVVDAEGNPVEGAEITLATEGGFVWNTHKRTDGKGALRLTRLIQGAVEIRAQKEDRLGAGAVTIDAGGAHRLRVTMR